MAVVSSLVNKTSPIKNVFLILALGLIASIILLTLSTASQREKAATNSHAVIDCYRAEIMMRMVDAMSYLPESLLFIKGDSPEKAHQKYSQIVLQAKSLLEKAAKAEPDNAVILSKKIILENKVKDDIQADLTRLASIIASGDKKESPATGKNLALLVHSIYGELKNNIDKSSILNVPNDAVKIIDQNLSDGWFREQALLQVYKLSHQIEDKEALQSSIKSRTWNYIFKMALITLVGAIAALSGILVLLYQVFIVSKESTHVDEELNIPTVELAQSHSGYSWQTVSFVFVSWFFTQVFIGIIYSVLQQSGLIQRFGETNSLVSAISIALVYLFSNGPALLYIYFFAIRPHGQKFLEGINLRLKVGNYGTISLITIGVLAWAAAVPLVMGAYFISATVFGSKGSSNPIISIVTEAAQSNNLLSIIVFYFTLGVLAPLLEESLFRGFFYTNLRTRYGVLASNLISSSLFAVAHVDIGAILPLFCLGSIFAFVCEKTKSILPSMLAHGLWNSATFTLVLLLVGG